MTAIPDWVRTAIAAIGDEHSWVPVAWVPLAWSGWEGDHTAVLLKRTGSMAIEILGRIYVGVGTEEQVLRKRIAVYRQLAANTEALLAQFGASPDTPDLELNEDLGWTMKQLRDRVIYAAERFVSGLSRPFGVPEGASDLQILEAAILSVKRQADAD